MGIVLHTIVVAIMVAVHGAAVAAPQNATTAMASASDPQALAALEDFLDSIGELQQSFVQNRYSAAGELLDKVTGRMALRQPDGFRWEVLHPWVQYIVANSDDFWSYDPDLQQAIKRSSKYMLRHTPAAILMRLSDPDEYFRVHFADITTSGSRALLLLPHDPDAASFAQLTVHYSDARLHKIEYSDAFGQRTELLFDELQEPFAATGPDFNFQPPPGVDVIEQ